MSGTAPRDRARTDVARRRRLAASVLVGGIAGAIVLVAGGVALASGLDRPVVALVLAGALLASNLTPVVAVRSGRLSAFTPVGALLVPIGLLLDVPTAVLVYAGGEVIGVLLSHRVKPRIDGPDAEPVVRTVFTLGKSVLGGTAGIVAMSAATALVSGVPGQALGAIAGIVVSSGFDHAALAVTAVYVRGARLVEELRRDAWELMVISGAEVVAGGLIAIMAGRDIWSLGLGLFSLGLVLIAATNYAHAINERAATRELLRLAEALTGASTVDDVHEQLLLSVGRLLPADEISLEEVAPRDDVAHSWHLPTPNHPDAWLAVPRLVETRDYQEQPLEVVDAAVSLARIALTRSSVQEQVVEQDKLRALVLSTVAHDLRSPLTATIGGLRMVLDRDETLGVSGRRQLLEVSSRSAARVLSLVNDILGLEIAQQRTPTRGPVEVGDVVDHVVDSLDVHQQVICRLDAGVAAIDDISLSRILENLIRNACKYSPAAGRVHVRGAPSSDGFEIVVSDEGPGVAVAQRLRIFDAFEQASAGRDGVGLGLFLARRFVELHDGRIWVDDASGGGAAFHVWLPAPDPSQPDEPADVAISR